MADVLGYLNEVTHRVSATFMPTEMEDVASFLRGDAWMLVTGQVLAQTSPSSNSNLPSSTGEPAEGEAPSETSTVQLRYPLGATRWGHYIPLGIAGTALVSAATSGSRAVLMHFFESSGFAQVFSVNFVPTEQQQQRQQQQGSVSGGSSVLEGSRNGGHEPNSANPFLRESMQRSKRTDADTAASSRKRGRTVTDFNNKTSSSTGETSAGGVIDVTLDGRCGGTAQAARHACTAAVRRWYEELEDSLREESSVQVEPRQFDRSSSAAPQILSSTSSVAAAKTQLRRLLILVRCCADNRTTVSTRVAGGGSHGAHRTNHLSSSNVGGGGGLGFAASSAARRQRSGADPLLLFLHDLAALATLYDARLARSRCSVRPAVLLLPEDESYGGALLQQRLREEVGYRYWVQLFLQSDPAHAATPHQPQRQAQAQHLQRGDAATSRPKFGLGESWQAALVGRSATHRNGLSSQQSQRHRQGEAPLLRGCRLAAFWGVLDASVLTAGEGKSAAAPQPSVRGRGDGERSDEASEGRDRMNALRSTVDDEQKGQTPSPSPPSSSSARAAAATTTHNTSEFFSYTNASPAQLEEALRRHPACFFARPSNAPLCVFLMEALRRCPLLATPAMLRHWQSTWTARHALDDLLFVFHTTVCPFILSAVYQDVPVTPAQRTRPAAASASATDTASSSFGKASASVLLRDATDLLDALLDAAFTLAEERDSSHPLSCNDFSIEQATLFMLMYEALVQRRVGRLRRIPAVVEVLVRFYDRHARAARSEAVAVMAKAEHASVDHLADKATDSNSPHDATTTTADAVRVDVSKEEKVRYAVQHLLPFAPPNVFYAAVEECTRQSLSADARRAAATSREVVAYPMNSLVLPLRRMTVAPQLQNTVLLSLLPPDASLLELRGVAEQQWTAELPQKWQYIVRTLSKREGLSRDATSMTRGEVSGVQKQHEVDDSKGHSDHTVFAASPTQLSAENFYHPLIPHAVRVLYLLTAHALQAQTESAKQVPVVQLQVVCQLTDEQLLLVLRELQLAGLASTNLKTQTARTLLDSI